jgi:GTPase KRas protein
MLVGNKADKTNEREVSKVEGATLAQSFGCSFMETSAKTAHNVDLLFTNLIRALRNTQKTAAEILQPRLDDKKLKKCVIL